MKTKREALCEERNRTCESRSPRRILRGFLVVLPAAPQRRTERVAIFYGRGRKTDNFRRRGGAVSARISGRGTGQVAFKLSETRAKTNGPRWAIWLPRGLLIHANSFAIFTPSTTWNYSVPLERSGTSRVLPMSWRTISRGDTEEAMRPNTFDHRLYSTRRAITSSITRSEMRAFYQIWLPKNRHGMLSHTVPAIASCTDVVSILKFTSV